MSTTTRLFLGAIGGITPYLIMVLSIDFKSAFNGYETLDVIGLVLRCIILMFLGALVTWLHRSESEPFKIYQLGIAAPALLATFINGNSGTNQVLPAPVSDGIVMEFSLFSQAYADSRYENADKLKAPSVSNSSRLLRGLIGKRIETTGDASWFVIVGVHSNITQARQHAAELTSDFNYEAKVYATQNKASPYSVIIAANVTEAEAHAVATQAQAAGVPGDVFLWQFD